jgi:hypothetical protein
VNALVRVYLQAYAGPSDAERAVAKVGGDGLNRIASSGATLRRRSRSC